MIPWWILEAMGPDRLDLLIEARARRPTVSGQAAKLGIGCFYLAKSYESEPPIIPDQIPGVNNPHMKGILWRETWERLDPDGQGQNWGFLDACFNASNFNSKYSALQIVPGIHSPSWFFDLPNAKQIISGAELVPSTVCFDPVFQAQWESAQTIMANRYKQNSLLKYVCLSGVGFASESFFAITPEEQAQADLLATELGYPDRVTAWKAGTTFLIDMYKRVWDPIPVVLVTGNPFGDDDGLAAQQAMFDYGDATYPGKFGARANDLSSRGPNIGQPSADIIIQISPNCTAVGYQFANHQNVNDPNPPDHLDLALNRGTDFGAHFIEVFADDADEGQSGQVLDNANTRMRSV